MPLANCPWMAARCPHYNFNCKDVASKHCFYVKTTTSTARANLEQLKAAASQSAVPDPGVQEQIRDLEEFLRPNPDDR